MVSDELISVIVPIYNAKDYLDSCIGSIAKQSYVNIEIILVNDGSTDGSDKICERWEQQDARIRMIHQTNGGVSKARNSGIRSAHANLIIMVDSDDYIAPHMIEIMYKGYQDNDADIVIGDFEQGESRDYVFSEGSPSCHEISFETAMRNAYQNGHDALRYIAPWGKLYRKDLFKEIVYPEGKIFEDIYVTHQILYKANKIIVCNQKLLYYFHHDDSIMHKPFHLGKLDYLEALKERIGFFNSHKFAALEIIAYEEYLHSLMWEYSRVRDILHDLNAKKEIKNRYREIYKKGYSSKRYPQETSVFLRAFYINPELIMLYWKINSFLKRIKK